MAGPFGKGNSTPGKGHQASGWDFRGGDGSRFAKEQSIPEKGVQAAGRISSRCGFRPPVGPALQRGKRRSSCGKGFVPLWLSALGGLRFAKEQSVPRKRHSDCGNVFFPLWFLAALDGPRFAKEQSVPRKAPKVRADVPRRSKGFQQRFFGKSRQRPFRMAWGFFRRESGVAFVFHPGGLGLCHQVCPSSGASSGEFSRKGVRGASI